MIIILDERDNTMIVSGDYDNDNKVYKVHDVKQTKQMLEHVLHKHTMSEGGTTIIAKVIGEDIEESLVP